MNRNRLGGGRDRIGRGYGGGDGLLGEGPGMGGGMFEPMINSHQVNQLMLAQQMLQQQAVLSNFGAGDYRMANFGVMGNSRYLQQQRSTGFIGKGAVRNDRKRRGGDRDRSRGRDSNRNSESRDVNRSEKEKDKDQAEGSKGESESTDDQERKDKEKDKEKEKEGNIFCHVCNVSVFDEDSFRRHMNGSKHAQRMNSLLTVHQLKSNQLKSRLQAEEHLRKIESKAGGVDPEFFCKICNNSLTIPWERHRFSNIHKQRQLQVKRGCGWCNVHDFTNFSEVLQHRETVKHTMNAELYGRKKSGSHSEDDEDLTIPEYNPENPVGVNYIIPVTGFFCKLCNKFYNNEKSAKGPHCQSEAHYDKFKLAIEAKQEAREKRLLEEAALKEKKEQEKAKKDSNKEENGNEKAEKNGEDHDDEDYDDDLPLEDRDNDGGLVDDDGDKADLSKDATSHGSFLNETSANSSFVFLSGDIAQAQLEQLQRQQLLSQLDDDDDDDDGIGNQSATDRKLGFSGKKFNNGQRTNDDASMDLSGEGDDREDDSDEDATAKGKLSAKSKLGNTGRKGHGKGKPKK